MSPETNERYDDVATLRARLAEILETWPLYRHLAYSGGASLHFTERTGYQSRRYGQLPSSIRRYCEGKECQNSQLWELQSEGSYTDVIRVYFSPGFDKRTYRCRNCGKESITYFFHWNETRWEQTQGATEGVFMKVGQWPPLSHTPPKELRKRLDQEDYSFYKKALDCRHFNYGLGAVAYMRRVVENRTNDLLDLIVDTLKAEGAPPGTLAEIVEVKKGTVYDRKLEVAQNVLPARLIREGSNPIKNLHTLTSQGIHELSEDECIETFDRSRAAFEYVFGELEVERARAEEYIKAMKALAEKANPKPGQSQPEEEKK